MKKMKKMKKMRKMKKMKEDEEGGVGQTWRLVLRDVVERTHGVHVEIGRLSLGQLNAGDTKGPDVHLPFVLPFVHGENDLRSHPVGGSYEAVGGAGNCRRAKICQLDVADISEQDIASLDVPVDSCLRVQVVQTIEATWKTGFSFLIFPVFQMANLHKWLISPPPSEGTCAPL